MSTSTEELIETIDDYIYDILNQQPRPNDYADDAGYDEAASEYADGIVEWVTLLIQQEQLKLIERVGREVIGYNHSAVDGLTMKVSSSAAIVNEIKNSQRQALNKLKEEIKGE